MSTTTSWPGDWLRGVLEMAVLRVLADEPASYGYAITLSLEAQGFGQVKGGTMYPLLSRLEDAGHVMTHWRPGDGGPGRKYYTITPTGREHLERSVASWCRFAGSTVTFLRHGTHGIPNVSTPTDASGMPSPTA